MPELTIDHPTLGRRPSLFNHDIDRDVWADAGRSWPDPDQAGEFLTLRLTHAEHADDLDAQRRRIQAFAVVLSDLDRCEHGRHEGDTCSLRGGCEGGTSLGNPVMRAAAYALGRAPFAQHHAEPRQIGVDLSGRPIVIPHRDRMSDPAAWRVQPDATEGV